MSAGFYRGRRVLVTGADGFIGSHLCRRLETDGANVFAMRRAEHGDLSESGVAARVFDEFEPEVVFHLASFVTSAQALDVVVPITISGLLAAARLLTAAAAQRSARVVLAGSMKEPEGDEAPSSPYAAAKGAQTAYARMFHELHGLDVVVARLFMVYGPDARNPDRFIPYIARTLVRGEVPQLTSCRQAIDWVYIDDAIDALLALGATDGLGGSRIDVGSGALVGLRTIAEEVARLAGASGRIVFGALPDRKREPVRVANAEETFRRTGWRAAIPLEEGLRRVVAWYRDEMEREKR
jgi:nucleoside-diphosphate-sugar epimerase